MAEPIDFHTAGDLRSTEVPAQVRSLAEGLARVHGPVAVAAETSGMQIYFACPRCLEIEGEKALQGKKFSVNADKACGLGRFRPLRGTYNARQNLASCMKCKQAYDLDTLLFGFQPLEERGYKESKSVVSYRSTERRLVVDALGVHVPPSPGRVIPVTQLPLGHPGRAYLKARGFDLAALEHQFYCAWCEEELPCSDELRIFYRHMPLGFRSTPQGRIIFFGMIRGSAHSWQGRIPEFTVGNHKHYWHPYERKWVLCEIRNPETGKFEPTPQILSSRYEWEMDKYRTATHAQRAAVVFGFDAAVAFADHTGDSLGFLMEGPLDAGRFGPPAMALTGKHLSERQAHLILTRFQKVVYFADKGIPGEQAKKSVMKHLGGHIEVIFEQLPDGVDDPGSAPADLVSHYRKAYLKHP
jgi:hypothetical protein